MGATSTSPPFYLASKFRDGERSFDQSGQLLATARALLYYARRTFPRVPAEFVAAQVSLVYRLLSLALVASVTHVAMFGELGTGE